MESFPDSYAQNRHERETAFTLGIAAPRSNEKVSHEGSIAQTPVPTFAYARPASLANGANFPSSIQGSASIGSRPTNDGNGIPGIAEDDTAQFAAASLNANSIGLIRHLSRDTIKKIRRGEHKQHPPFVVREMSYREMHRSPSLSRLSRSSSFSEVIQKSPSPPRPLSRSHSFRDPLPSELHEAPERSSSAPFGDSRSNVMRWMDSDDYLQGWSTGYASRPPSRPASPQVEWYPNPPPDVLRDTSTASPEGREDDRTGRVR